jgi:uncharacterized protein (TIGR03067 family)
MEERRVVIYGNAGSGKTTMARRLGLPILSLDAIAWTAVGVRAPLADSLAALEEFMSAHSGWVIEGCYGDLVEAAAARCTELRFLNPGAAVCVANARNRPWEPSYCESPEQQQELLGPLIEFIHAYEHMAGECGLARHRAIFAAHAGPKREYTGLDGAATGPDAGSVAGVWSPLRSWWEDIPTPPEGLPDVTLIFAEGRCEVRRGGELIRWGAYATDSSRSPKTIDVCFSESDVPELIDAPLLGIYEVDGDRLRICYGPPGGGRPPSFLIERGTGRYLGQYRRRHVTG